MFLTVYNTMFVVLVRTILIFLNYNLNTRDSGATAVLPKVNLVFAWESFCVLSASIFNSLPLKTGQISSRILFSL